MTRFEDLSEECLKRVFEWVDCADTLLNCYLINKACYAVLKANEHRLWQQRRLCDSYMNRSWFDRCNELYRLFHTSDEEHGAVVPSKFLFQMRQYAKTNSQPTHRLSFAVRIKNKITSKKGSISTEQFLDEILPLALDPWTQSFIFADPNTGLLRINKINVWLNEVQWQPKVRPMHDSKVRWIGVSAWWIVSGDEAGKIAVFARSGLAATQTDIDNEQPFIRMPLQTNAKSFQVNGAITTGCLTDGRVAVGTRVGSVSVRDLETGTALFTLLTAHGRVNQIQWSCLSSHRDYIWCAIGNALRCWSVPTIEDMRDMKPSDRPIMELFHPTNCDNSVCIGVQVHNKKTLYYAFDDGYVVKARIKTKGDSLQVKTVLEKCVCEDDRLVSISLTDDCLVATTISGHVHYLDMEDFAEHKCIDLWKGTEFESNRPVKFSIAVSSNIIVASHPSPSADESRVNPTNELSILNCNPQNLEMIIGAMISVVDLTPKFIENANYRTYMLERASDAYQSVCKFIRKAYKSYSDTLVISKIENYVYPFLETSTQQQLKRRPNKRAKIVADGRGHKGCSPAVRAMIFLIALRTAYVLDRFLKHFGENTENEIVFPEVDKEDELWLTGGDVSEFYNSDLGYLRSQIMVGTTLLFNMLHITEILPLSENASLKKQSTNGALNVYLKKGTEILTFREHGLKQLYALTDTIERLGGICHDDVIEEQVLENKYRQWWRD